MAGQMVSFPSNGGQADGYLAMPSSRKGPGVVVIQEWWGLVPQIKGVADRLAAEGYVALAPDLYHGKTTKEPDEASKMMMSMKIDQAAKDMSGAYDYLEKHDATSGKTGSVGFCMGGALSLYVATLRPVDACVIYYGVGPEADVSKLKGAVLGHYAGNDSYMPPEKVHALEQQIRDAGEEVEFHIYPGTEHGFFNETRSEVYNESAAKRTWERTLAFYKKHLS